MTTFTVKSPVDVISIVPHMLGFHPENSLVVLVIGGFAARVDMPTDIEGVEGMLAVAEAVNKNAPNGTAFVICYTEDHLHSYLAAGAIMSACPGVTWPDALRVHEGHYYGLEEPVPDEGTRFCAVEIPGMDPQKVAISRDDLKNSLTVETSAQMEALIVDQAINVLTSSGTLPVRPNAEWLAEVILRREPFTDEQIARIVVLGLHPELFDVIIAAADRATKDKWFEACKRCSLSPVLYAALAYTAWWSGDGALSWLAIDEARRVGNLSFVDTVARLNQSVINPHTYTGPVLEDLPAFKED